MRVLVNMEASGAIRDAFLALGHDAWSNDLRECEADPARHMRMDAIEASRLPGWDLMICHPVCTFLTGAAEWAFSDPDYERYPGVGYHQRVKPGTLTGEARREAREKALAFALALWSAPVPRICIENPVGALSRILPKPQVIQPYDFGEDASKATCLFLKGLLPLRKTERFPPRIIRGRPRWGNQTDSGQNRLSPGERRWIDRSRTYPGIARAMAEQWGGPA